MKQANYSFLSGSEEYNDEAKAIAISSQGYIYVAGYSTDTVQIEDEGEVDTIPVTQYTLIKYDTTNLSQQWVSRVNRYDEDEGECLV